MNMKSLGNYEISLDAEALPPGKYYYKVMFSGMNGNGKQDAALSGDTIASGQVKIEI